MRPCRAATRASRLPGSLTPPRRVHCGIDPRFVNISHRVPPVKTFSESARIRTKATPLIVPNERRIEEERLPFYTAERYYPVRLGEIFQDRFKVIAKLGYGTASTSWLCRDMTLDRYMTVKIGVTRQESTDVDPEIAISEYLSPIDGTEHPGKQLLRLVKEHFLIKGPGGTHLCLVFDPLGLSLTDLQNYLPGETYDKIELQQTLFLVCLALDFLHQAQVVHTDLSPNNVLVGVNENESSKWAGVEQRERDFPTSRKIMADRTIYVSADAPITTGQPVIIDFGNARIGGVHRGDIMPGIYRAPEVILGMAWSFPVDIWSVGMMIWNLLEGDNLFDGTKEDVLNDEQHLAEMVSLMGPPPPSFIERSLICRKYWDNTGKWIAATPIPEQSFETRVTKLEGQDKRMLLSLARKILRWLPEERPSAEALTGEEFITQYLQNEQEA